MLKFKWETEFKETEIGEIPKDWEVKRLGEFIQKAKNGSTPPTKDKSYWNGEIPWITSNHLRSLYVFKGDRYVTKKAINERKTSIANKGALLFGTRIGIGNVAIAGRELAFNQDVTAIWLKESIKGEYLVRLIRSEFYQRLLKDIAEGTTVGGIDRETLLNLPIVYPSSSEQSRIATVLSWFDDLIENKKRQNEILEKVAMAIFKSWFVDFEPFKDEEFVYNEELGKEIPKGWEVDFATKFIDFNPPIRLIKGKVYPFVEMKQVSTNSAVCDFDYKEFTGSGVRYRGGDTLMARITPSLEHGKTAYVWFISEEEYGFGTTEFFVLHPKEPYLKEFTYLLAKSDDFRDVAINSMTGTSGRQRADVNALKNFLIPIPPQPILQRFHSLVEPLFQKIILNQKQIMVLRKIRDALLPKLVFGKLRVEEI